MLKNLKLYVKYNKVKIIFIINMWGDTVNVEQKPVLSKELKEMLKDLSCPYHVVDKSINIGSISIANIYQYPQQINPLTQCKRYCEEKTAITIFGGTKQSVESLHNSHEETASLICSTGCCTRSLYRKNRAGLLAEHTHKFGFVTFNLQSDKFFDEFRTVEIVDTSLYDKNKQYSNGKVTITRPTLITPDIHSTTKSDEIWNTLLNYWKEKINPSKIFAHDVADLISISYFIGGNQYQRWKNSSDGITLRKELDMTWECVDNLLKINNDAKLFIVRSNHDERLNTCAERICEYLPRVQGTDIPILTRCFNLLTDENKENKPVNLLEKMYERDIGKNKRVKFLGEGDVVKQNNYLLSKHFAKGLSGSKATLNGLESQGIKAIGGDKHSTYLRGNLTSSGTVISRSNCQSYHYNNGFCNWNSGFCLLHSNGSRQCILLKDCELST